MRGVLVPVLPRPRRRPPPRRLGSRMQALNSAGTSVVLNLGPRLLLKVPRTMPRKRQSLTLIARQMLPAGVGNEVVATAEAGVMDMGVALAMRTLVQSSKH